MVGITVSMYSPLTVLGGMLATSSSPVDYGRGGTIRGELGGSLKLLPRATCT